MTRAFFIPEVLAELRVVLHNYVGAVGQQVSPIPALGYGLMHFWVRPQACLSFHTAVQQKA